MENIKSDSLHYALESKIISCTAGAWPTGDSYCLPLNTAVDIINTTRSRVVVAHMSNEQKRYITAGAPSEGRWGIKELCEKLSLPKRDIVLFLNTALCMNEEELNNVANVFLKLYQIDPFKQSRGLFLKMEIFDGQIHLNDEKTCNVLRQLPESVRHSCLPYMTGNPKWLHEAIELGCPGLRIWCSEIGKGKGIVDEARLKKAVSLSTVPLILEGGLATPDHVRHALELGFDAVLLNSAFRKALDPVALAHEMREIVDTMGYGNLADNN